MVCAVLFLITLVKDLMAATATAMSGDLHTTQDNSNTDSACQQCLAVCLTPPA
jgi:hypothetical protein